MDNILIDICFSIIYFSVPVLSLKIVKYSGISIYKFSIPSFFLIFYFIFAYIGILPLYFGWDPNRIELGVVNREIIIMLLVYSSSALLAIIFGFIFANKVLGLSLFLKHRQKIVPSNNKQSIFVFVLFLLCGLILLAYVKQVEALAISKIISGDYVGAAITRSNMGNAFEGKYWRYQLFFRLLLDYCVIFYFSQYLVSRKYIPFLLFSVSFSVAAFSAIMALEKGPLANLMIMLYLAYVIRRGGGYWQPATKLFLLMFVAVLIAIYLFSIGGIVGDRSLSGQLMAIVGRIFTGQITPAYFYLEMFPTHFNYLMGTSFPNPGAIFPFDNFPLTKEVSNYMFPTHLAEGLVGSAPTVFWGEMYANFGPLAVVFSSFFVGIGLYILGHILAMLPLTPPVVAATAILAIHYETLSATSLSNYFIDTTLIAIGVVTLMLLLLRQNTGSFKSPRSSEVLNA